MGQEPLALALLLALVPLAAIAQPFECAAGCTDRGNCDADTGNCICPYGHLGKACEIDALSACRLVPGGDAICGPEITMNCHCWRQCDTYHCRGQREPCEVQMPPGDRGCFVREGLAVEQQRSNAPEEGEQGVKYFKGWREGSPEVDAANTSAVHAAMSRHGFLSIPQSECPQSCNDRGFCAQRFEDGKPTGEPICRCLRGSEGSTCEIKEKKLCYLDCNGHGECKDTFCHCKAPWFGLGCSRNHSVPHVAQRPSPVDFKIYIYDLSSEFAYHYQDFPGYRDFEGTGLYAAYRKFLEQLLLSPVRTYDPGEANLFYVPAMVYAYSKMALDGVDHLQFVLNHVRMNYPYWNRTNGRDHVVFHGIDRGGCHLDGLALQPIVITHFGFHLEGDLQTAGFESIRERGTGKGYGCYHPLRDVVAVPEDTRHQKWAVRSQNMTIDEIVAMKKRLFFFSGGGVEYYHESVTEFSGNSRQTLNKLIEQWQDDDIAWFNTNKPEQPQVPDYEMGFREAKFCMAPYGWGWGIRLPQAVVANCIPVIVQERIVQPYEDLLPYETFSVRLTNADLPRLRDILRGISDEQYKAMMQELVRARSAFYWYPDQGGRAFDFMIASLRRRWLNLKSLYY